MSELEVRVGGRLGPLGIMPEGRGLFHEYLEDLDDPSITKATTRIARTTRDWWRRRYPPTARGNWREYAGPPGIPQMPPMEASEERRIRSVPNGERTKSYTFDIPTTLTPTWVGGIPLTQPELSDETVSDMRSLHYQIGSVEDFHECSDSWEHPIESYMPFCGLVRTPDHIEWKGYVPETHPEDIRYSRGHFDSFDLVLGTPRLVPTRDYPCVAARPSASDVEYARRDALISMYGGTPGHNPNVLRSILELKDARKTINGLVHFYKWSRSMVNGSGFWRKAGNSWRRLSSSQIAHLSTREMASAYLNGVFGIAPTLDDVGVFFKRVLYGLKIFTYPRGRPAVPGMVITSHYNVRPKFDVKSFTTSRVQRHRLSTHVQSQQMHCSGDFDCVPLGSGFLASNAPDVAAEFVHGCVFARLKDDLSDYFLKHFGEIGWTWSYPPILTAWELMPWSWMIDWFAETRRSIRLAERAARTFWMRVGFEDPWLAERVVTRRYCHRLYEDRTTRSDNRVFWPSYNQRVLDAFTTSYYTSATGASHEVSGRFWRGPYVNAPRIGSNATKITVKAFQISVGMALVLQTR